MSGRKILESEFYDHLLRHQLKLRRDKNPRYSLRAFAKDLEISPALLSLLLKRKRAITPRTALILQRSASIQPENMRAQRNPPEASERPVRARYHSPEFVQVKPGGGIRAWEELALLDLTTLKTFRSDVRWISQALGLSYDRVLESIDHLVESGFLTERNGEFSKSKKKIQVSPVSPHETIRAIHRTGIKKAMDELERIDLDSFKKRSITSMTLAVNPKHYPEAERRIEAFQQELADLLTEGECTDLYQLNVQLFSILKKT